MKLLSMIQAFGRKPCLANSFCQCKGRGLQIKVLFQRFQACLRKLGEDGALQAKLLEGRVVLVWVSGGKNSANEGEQDPSSREPVSEDDVFYTLTHLSLLYLRPWRPTLTAVQAADNETIKCISRAFGRNSVLSPANLSMWFRLKVESSLDGMVDVISIWEHLNQFDLELGLAVSFLELSERQTPTNDLTVFSAKIIPIECKVLWRGLEVEGRMPRAVAASAREILEEPF